MDNGETQVPWLAVDDILNLNKPLLPSTNSLIPPILPQEPADQFAYSDIDWVSLLSAGSFGDHQNHSSPPILAAGDGENVGKNKKAGRNYKAKKATPPRIAFHTRSVDDILDDGYRWRKYGQKAVKNSIHQRSYYRCTHHTCNVKKQIERLTKDSSIVVTTYEGTHNHPCEKVMETLIPFLRQLQFLFRV